MASSPRSPADAEIGVDAIADAGSPIGRRIVLGLLATGGAGVLWGSHAADAVNRFMGPITAADPTGLTSFIPAAGGFRIYSVTGRLPKRAAADWSMTVDGLVDRPTTVRYADLAAMPQRRIVRDFQCVTGWRVAEVPWSGVRLRDLLDHVGVGRDAAAIRFESFDGSYSESLTLRQARAADVLVATGMQDNPISSVHGGPVRLYIGSMYGYKSLKWLSRIEVTARVVPGYWERRGYAVDGFVGHSNGRDDRPT